MMSDISESFCRKETPPNPRSWPSKLSTQWTVSYCRYANGYLPNLVCVVWGVFCLLPRYDCVDSWLFSVNQVLCVHWRRCAIRPMNLVPSPSSTRFTQWDCTAPEEAASGTGTASCTRWTSFQGRSVSFQANTQCDTLPLHGV